MWRILQHKTAEDFVIATGQANSLESFLSVAFAVLDLDWRSYVVIDEALFRPSDILFSKGNATKALTELGWKARIAMEEIARLMVLAEIDNQQTSV
jgi:GDPmannose 4,6-dehydratase